MPRTKKVPMTPLSTAEAALAAAQEREQQARSAFSTAQAHALALRQSVASDPSTKVNHVDIAVADDVAEHARLVLQGAEAPVAALSETVIRARADEFCDEILRTAPELGSAVQDALDAMVAPLAEFQRATAEYDRFIEDAQRRVAVYGQEIPRVVIQRAGPIQIDTFTLRTCRPASQLASEILSTMRGVGAPHFVIEQLSELARVAPTLPTR
jgi:hypothetical protein